MAPQPLSTLQSLLHDALAETPPGRSIWVALSGGLDSCLLVTLAAMVGKQANRCVRAVHINHGLQAAAQTFEAHSRALCERLNVPLTVVNVTVAVQGQGIEAAARNARYEAFYATLAPGDALWLAQHQDDQAETFLLAALRGSGLRGLVGMPYQRESQGITLVRPWLSARRAELEAAARSLALTWWEDPTNSDISFDRNRLRHRVLPEIQERWPGAASALANSAAHAYEADAVLGEYVAAELAGLMTDDGQVDVDALTRCSRPRQRLLVRALCQQQGFPSPPQKRLESLLQQLTAKADAEVCVEWPGVQARLWRQRLYVMTRLESLPPWDVFWDGQTPLETPLGRLGWQVACSQRLRVAWRKGGEVIQLPGRGRRDLKRLLQEASVPPWERERLVVVMQAEACIGVISPPDRLLWQAEGVEFTPQPLPA